jgi:hypothetical protein
LSLCALTALLSRAFSRFSVSSCSAILLLTKSQCFSQPIKQRRNGNANKVSSSKRGGGRETACWRRWSGEQQQVRIGIKDYNRSEDDNCATQTWRRRLRMETTRLLCHNIETGRYEQASLSTPLSSPRALITSIEFTLVTYSCCHFSLLQSLDFFLMI